MRNLPLYENWLNEDNTKLLNVFKQKMTTDSYLDMKNFWRSELGYDEEDNLNLKVKAFDKSKTLSIDINQIVPNQDYLNSITVNLYSKNKKTEIPTGVQFKNGNVIVFDGHHRIASQIINGDKSINMKILKAKI
jgi:hypothetical protein